MIRAFGALWRAIKDIFEDFSVMVTCNIVWALISLPLFLLALYLLITTTLPTLVGMALLLLGVLPAAPATAGLYHVGHRISEGRVSRLSDFFVGMRQYALPAIKVLGIWAVGMLIIPFNLSFYGGNAANLVGWLLFGLWLYLMITWSSLIIYAFPLILLQEQPDLRTLARNTLIMTLGRPGFTLTTALLMFGFLLLTNLMPILLPLFSGALLTQWSLRATLTLIAEDNARRQAAEEAAEQAAPPVEEKGRKGQVRPK